MTQREKVDIGGEIASVMRLIELRRYWNKEAEVVLADIERDLRNLLDARFPGILETVPHGSFNIGDAK